MSDANQPNRFLARFGDPLFMRQLVEEGRLLLRDFEYYSKLDIAGRGDPNEGALAHHDSRRPGSWAFLKAGKKRFTLKESRLFGPARKHGLYCMSLLETEGPLTENQWASFSVEAATMRHTAHESFSLGTGCVAILNPIRFIQRFAVAAWKAGYAVVGSPVTYYSEYPMRPLMPCEKAEAFAWQREYRLVTLTPIDRPTELNLGPLLDIAQYIEVPRRRAFAS